MMRSIVLCSLMVCMFQFSFGQIQIGGSQPEKTSTKTRVRKGKEHKKILNDSIDNKIKIFLGASYASTYRTLTPNKNELFADSLGQRINERAIGNWAVNLGFASEINKYLLWEAGVSYLTNGEQYQFSDVDTSHTYTNKYSWIGVPLKLYFKYDVKRFRFQVGGGFIPQMQMKYRVKETFKNANQKETSSDVLTINGLNTFGIAAIANAGVHFNLSKRIGIYALFEYRHQLTNTFIKTKPYNHKGTALGVNFGLTFGF